MEMRRHILTLAALAAFTGGALTFYYSLWLWLGWLGVCFLCGWVCAIEKEGEE